MVSTQCQPFCSLLLYLPHSARNIVLQVQKGDLKSFESCWSKWKRPCFVITLMNGYMLGLDTWETLLIQGTIIWKVMAFSSLKPVLTESSGLRHASTGSAGVRWSKNQLHLTEGFSNVQLEKRKRIITWGCFEEKADLYFVGTINKYFWICLIFKISKSC